MKIARLLALSWIILPSFSVFSLAQSQQMEKESPKLSKFKTSVVFIEIDRLSPTHKDYRLPLFRIRMDLLDFSKPPAEKSKISFAISPKKYAIRLDSGTVPFKNIGLRTFGAYSHAEGDKWKGPGKHPKYSDQYGLGVSQNVGRLSYQVFYNAVVEFNHLYRGFTFSEIKDNAVFRSRDYTDTIVFPNQPLANVLYYQFYREKISNQKLNSVFNLTLKEDLSLNLKGYLTQNSTSLSGAFVSVSSDIFLRDSKERLNEPGGALEVGWKVNPSLVIFWGYWRERSEAKHWRLSRKVEISPESYYTLSRSLYDYEYIQRTITTLEAPYLTLKSEEIMEKVDLEFGFTFLYVRRNFKDYNTASLAYHETDKVYDDPLLTPRVNFKKTYDKFLPSLKAEIKFMPELKANVSYSRISRTPTNLIGKLPRGMDTNFIEKHLRPEQWDEYTLRLRFGENRKNLSLYLTYANYRDKYLRLSDPEDTNVVYLRNLGKAQQIGLGFDVSYTFYKGYSVFFSFVQTQTKLKSTQFYDGNNFYAIKDKKVPDVPLHYARFGLRFKLFEFMWEPSADYVGQRYGNLTNTEKTDPYLILNLSFSRPVYKRIALNGRIINLTNNKYVGKINPGASSGTYFAGSPIVPAFFITGEF